MPKQTELSTRSIDSVVRKLNRVGALSARTYTDDEGALGIEVKLKQGKRRKLEQHMDRVAQDEDAYVVDARPLHRTIGGHLGSFLQIAGALMSIGSFGVTVAANANAVTKRVESAAERVYNSGIAAPVRGALGFLPGYDVVEAGVKATNDKVQGVSKAISEHDYVRENDAWLKQGERNFELWTKKRAQSHGKSQQVLAAAAGSSDQALSNEDAAEVFQKIHRGNLGRKQARGEKDGSAEKKRRVQTVAGTAAFGILGRWMAGVFYGKYKDTSQALTDLLCADFDYNLQEGGHLMLPVFYTHEFLQEAWKQTLLLKHLSANA